VVSLLRKFMVVAVMLGAALTGSWSAEGVTGKGEEPTAITVAHGSVWVADGSGRVARVDARTRRVLRTYRLGRFVWALTPAAGSVWASSDRGIFRLDASTGRARAVSAPVSGVTAIAARSGAIWFGSSTSDRIVRYDVRRSRVRATISVSGRFWGLRAGPAGVWAQVVPTPGPVTERDRRVIVRIDERRNRLGRPRLVTACDSELAVDRSVVWVAESCLGTLRRFQAGTGRPVGAAIRVAAAPTAIAVGFGSVWVATVSGSVARIDRETGAVQAAIDIPAPIAIAAGAGAIWVASGSRPGVLRSIDPATNRVSVGPPAP
jgi:streptogramin lyase